MPPAARITDMHTCPMFTGPVPHVGGPILPPCCPTVIIGGIPAARVSDMCVCTGPPDAIAMGSPTVFIGGMMAARIGDPTIHGGVIVQGFPTVIIGNGAGSGGGGGSAATGGGGHSGGTPGESGDGSPSAKEGEGAGKGADPAEELKKWREGKKDAIEKALKNQRAILEKKKKELETWDDAANANFKKAFGKTDDASKKIIQDRIDKMLALNEKMTVDNFKPASPSKKGRFAYVYRTDKDHTVYLDEAFDRAPESGKDSTAGALSHEMSHFEDVGGTNDKFKDYNDDKAVYGPTASRKLAADDPDKALKHADSFEYYVEEVP